MNRKIMMMFFAGALLAGSAAFAAAAGVCVWSCQQNPSGSWSYWFARALSDCPVTDCIPNGSSPSGTPCTQGDPDIPGTCRARADQAEPIAIGEPTPPPGGSVCSAQLDQPWGL
jgi:hypothetical protein